LFDAYFWSLLFSIALLPIDFYYRYRSVCLWVWGKCVGWIKLVFLNFKWFA
jgi:hypothetical protein